MVLQICHLDNEGVLKLLLDLQPHKATGPDKISTRLLNEIAYIIVPVLTLLFQASLVYLMIGKQPMFAQYLRKMTILIHLTIDQCH